MTIETSERAQEMTHTETSEHLSPWQELEIRGERFLVKRDRLVPAENDWGEEIVFHVNEYHHPETGMQIQVWNVGLDRPINEPALVRADYGCPCMVLGSSFKVPGHDCAAQRQMMVDTMQEIGIGAMAVVSEQTAAGNGHGSHAVFDQATAQYLAVQRGEMPPTMQEYFSEQEYQPFDSRRHDLVGLALSDTLGTQRSVIAAMASEKKIQQLQDAGLNVVQNMRIELHTDPDGVHSRNLRRDGYPDRLQASTAGPYLIASGNEGLRHSVPLTRDTYAILFQTSRITSRRLPN